MTGERETDDAETELFAVSGWPSNDQKPWTCLPKFMV